MQEIAETGLNTSYIFNIGAGANLNDNWEAFVERALQPFFDFVGERIAAGNSTLHVLERYIRRVEWFTRSDLHARYTADTRNGEEVYNLDLQRFLFEDGGYITHAKARSASGEPDLVGALDTADPLICDGKLFDADGRSKAYVAKGFHQVIQYAQDYNKNAAYLVVFNLSGRLLQFPTDSRSGAWPPYVESTGVRVYFIGVRAHPPQTTASKAGKASPLTIAREELFDPDAD